jgi:hypothetical protein
MRTSNKILCGTLLIILLILTAIHAALYAKYKQNNFVTLKHLHNERYDSYDLKGIQSVSITGFQNVTVIPADTARMEIEKSGADKLQYEFSNGALVMKGDTLIMRNNSNPDRISNYRNVILYLPHTQVIKSDDCGLTIQGTKDSSNTSSLVLDLTDTELHLGNENREDNSTGNIFDKISVTRSKGGAIEIAGTVVVKELNLDIESSNFNDGNAAIGTLSVHADSSSVIKLSGKNIVKAKFTLK